MWAGAYIKQRYQAEMRIKRRAIPLEVGCHFIHTVVCRWVDFVAGAAKISFRVILLGMSPAMQRIGAESPRVKLVCDSRTVEELSEYQRSWVIHSKVGDMESRLVALVEGCSCMNTGLHCGGLMPTPEGGSE